MVRWQSWSTEWSEAVTVKGSSTRFGVTRPHTHIHTHGIQNSTSSPQASTKSPWLLLMLKGAWLPDASSVCMNSASTSHCRKERRSAASIFFFRSWHPAKGLRHARLRGSAAALGDGKWREGSSFSGGAAAHLTVARCTQYALTGPYVHARRCQSPGTCRIKTPSCALINNRSANSTL